MADANPQKFTSVQEYLEALNFTVEEDFFVHDDVRFPVSEIIGHTVNSFHERAKRKGWLDASNDPPLTEWAQRFMMV